MNSIFRRSCLLEQPFIMNPDLTIQQYLSQRTAEIGEKLSIAVSPSTSWARALRSAARTSLLKWPLPSSCLPATKRAAILAALFVVDQPMSPMRLP